MKNKFEVYEDNGEGLAMFIFDEEGKLIFGHSGYEFRPQQLLEDIEALKDGSDVSEWDGNGIYTGTQFLEWGDGDLQTLEQFYEDYIGSEWVELVADSDNIYPEKMNGSALEIFGIELKD